MHAVFRGIGKYRIFKKLLEHEIMILQESPSSLTGMPGHISRKGIGDEWQVLMEAWNNVDGGREHGVKGEALKIINMLVKK